jgi:ankyrin repeat protein
MAIRPNLTPLQWAAQRGAVGVVRALLAEGVDAEVTDEQGKTAAMMAIEAQAKAFPEMVDTAEAILGLLLRSKGLQTVR